MMHSDPIADLLTRIRNASGARLTTTDCPYSSIKEDIVKILKAEGLIADYEISKETKFPNLRIHLRYDAKRQPVLREIRRVSKPGLRAYRGAEELTPVRSGLATQIVSTNKGMMTDREARKHKIGGEVICEVW
ncbi:MAG: 30S ribosomal protein S8 [Fimbriimonadales bacterium]